MKRDLDLIRNILLVIENSDTDRLFISDFVTDSRTEEIVSHHLKLLLDCDYIDATSRNTIGCPYTQFIVHRITSKGYDYLDSVRDVSIWEKTKKALLQVGGSASLDTVKAVASSIILKMLGI